MRNNWTPTEIRCTSYHREKKLMEKVASHYRNLGFNTKMVSYGYDWYVEYTIPNKIWWKRDSAQLLRVYQGDEK